MLDSNEKHDRQQNGAMVLNWLQLMEQATDSSQTLR